MNDKTALSELRKDVIAAALVIVVLTTAAWLLTMVM